MLAAYDGKKEASQAARSSLSRHGSYEVPRGMSAERLTILAMFQLRPRLLGQSRDGAAADCFKAEMEPIHHVK